MEKLPDLLGTFLDQCHCRSWLIILIPHIICRQRADTEELYLIQPTDHIGAPIGEPMRSANRIKHRSTRLVTHGGAVFTKQSKYLWALQLALTRTTS